MRLEPHQPTRGSKRAGILEVIETAGGLRLPLSDATDRPEVQEWNHNAAARDINLRGLSATERYFLRRENEATRLPCGTVCWGARIG